MEQKASYTVKYQGKDITRVISDMVLRIVYRDKAIGEADELNISMDNSDLRWMNAWNPKIGDTIEVEITDSEGLVLKCGTFSVDEPEFSGSAESGDICDIKALGMGALSGVRTKTSFAHEGKTLKQIVNAIAEKYHYTFTGLTKNFNIDRVTQFHESDLAFLQRVAEDFGYLFVLKGTTLVFTYLPELHKAKSALVVTRTKGMPYRIVDKVMGIYVKGRNRFFDPKQKKLHDTETNSEAVSGDTLNSVSPVGSDEANIYKVGGRLYKKNMGQVEMSVFGLPGSAKYVAGSNIDAKGFGVYDVKYMIAESTHTITANGNHTTDILLKKIVHNSDKALVKPKDNDVAVGGDLPYVDLVRKIYDELGVMLKQSVNGVLPKSMFDSHNMSITALITAIRTLPEEGIADDVDVNYQAVRNLSTVAPASLFSAVGQLKQYLYDTYLFGQNI